MSWLLTTELQYNCFFSWVGGWVIQDMWDNLHAKGLILSHVSKGVSLVSPIHLILFYGWDLTFLMEDPYAWKLWYWVWNLRLEGNFKRRDQVCKQESGKQVVTVEKWDHMVKDIIRKRRKGMFSKYWYGNVWMPFSAHSLSVLD